MKRLFFIVFNLFFSYLAYSAALCDFPTGHLNDANFGDANGRILLSVENIGANQVRLTVKPNYANGATQKLDFLYVEASSNLGNCSPYPATAGVDESGTTYDELSVDLTYPAGATTATFSIQWSNPSWGGRWLATPSGVDITSACQQPIYFVNTPNWPTPYAHLWNGGASTVWPGVAMTNTGKTTHDDLAVWSVDYGSYESVKFSNNGESGSGDQVSFTEGRYFNYTDDRWYTPDGNTLNINAGGWQEIDFDWVNTSKTVLTATVDLAASTTYEFYLHGGMGDYFKNNGTMTSSNCTNWKMNEGSNCHITTEHAGTYTFNYDFATNHLSVVYPIPSICEGDLGHFGTPATKRIHYTIEYLPSTDKIRYTVQGYGGQVLDYLEIFTSNGNSGSLAIVGGVATWLQSAPASGTEMGINFLYSTDAIGGNEMNAESVPSPLSYTGNNANLVRYFSHDCEAVEPPAPTPVSSGEHFGTAMQTGVVTYALTDNKPVGSSVSTVSYYIVDCGEQLIFKAKTNGVQTFATSPWSVQLRSWNDAKTGFQENWAQQFTDANKTAYVRLGAGNQNNWNGTHVGAVPMTMYIEGLGAQCSPDWIDYQRGYINNPTGDVTPPSITNATDADAGANIEITITGADDNSGNWFYYIEDEEHDFYMVSLENVISIPKNSRGITYNFDCYVVDFDGNKSVAKQVSVTMPFDPVQNLALNQPAYAGFGDNPQFSNNGNLGDRWGSSGAPKDYSLDWWYVDLGAKYNLTEVDIFWEGAYAENFYIQVATENPAGDDSKWTTVHTQTTAPTVGNAEANKNVYDVTGSVGRWVRIKSTLNSLGNAWGMSIWEVRVYGSSVASDDANPPTMISATYVSDNVGRTGAILELHATDLEGDVNKFRVVEAGGATVNLTTDVSNRATLDGLTSGLHTYNVYAVDAAGNVSTNYETLSVCFLNPADNLAAGKTSVAGWSRTSVEINDNETPNKANDGIGGSGTAGETEHRQWGINAANFPTKAWWAVDLGQKYQLSNIDIYWNTGDGNVPRSYLVQVATESPADFVNDAARQNLVWETVATVSNTAQNTGSGSANRNRYSFTVGNNVVARYVRIVNLDDTRIAMYLREVEVFAHAIVCDDNAPTMVSAAVVSTSSANATVELHANDAEDGSDAVRKFKLVELVSGVPATAAFVSTNASHRVTLTDLTTGTHTYNVYAIDSDGNVSANYEALTLCVCNTTENLALNKPVVAGYTPGNAGEVPTKANDGALNSFWTTYNDRPIAEHWWSVDLGGVYNLSRVEVSWLTGTQSNHYLIQVAHVAPADRADDLQWYTVREVDEAQVSGASGADDKNSYSLSATARYVRIKMLSREATYIAMKEFRVFGSACADLDNTAPVISSATVVSTDATTGEATIQITSTDDVTSTVNTYIITNTATSERIQYVADGLGQIVLSGFESCNPTTINIQAKDEAANISSVTPLIVTVTPSTTVNLARTATVMAGFTEGGSNVANAIDGNLATQWQSTGATAGTNEWYTIDLGRMYDLNEVKIRWGLVAGIDDGGDYPTDFRLQVSDNNTTWATFAHYSSPTPTGTWLDVTSTGPLPARYVRVWADAHATYSMGIREIEVYSKNACYVADGKPVITLAEVTAVNPTSVDVHCESWAAGKTHDQIRYYYELTNNATSATTTGSKTHTSGNFSFDGLTKGVSYTARIYAEIITGAVRSVNYKEITFSVTYSSLHYLTEEIECVWEAGINKHEWQFKYTDNFSPTEVDGLGNALQILSYTDHTIVHDVAGTPPTIQYKLYEAGYGGSLWTTGLLQALQAQ